MKLFTSHRYPSDFLERKISAANVNIMKPTVSIVSSSYVRYLRFCGLYPITNGQSMTTTGKVIPNQRRWLVWWSYFVAVIVSVLSLASLTDYTMFYLQALTSLEFFQLVSYYAKLELAVQTVFIFAIMLWKSGQIHRFLEDMAVGFSDLIAADKMIKMRNRNAGLAFGWIALCLIVQLSTWIISIWDDLQTPENFTASIQFLSLVLPMYLNDLVLTCSKMINLNIEMVEQCFYFMLIAILAAGFDEVNQRLRKIQQTKDDSRVTALRDVEQVYLRLRTLTNKFNDCFDLLVLMSFLREWCSSIAVVAILLRVYEPPGTEESSVAYAERMYEDTKSDHYDVVVGCIGIANCILRAFLCLRCHGKVQTIAKTLQELESTSASPTTREECKRVLSGIDYNSGAISIAGISITKESFTSVMGLLAGYGILIYQTRDGMVGDQKYAKKSDLPELASLILEIIQNQTDFSYDSGYLNDTALDLN